MIRFGVTTALVLTAGTLLVLMHPSTPAFQAATAGTPQPSEGEAPVAGTDLRYLSTLSSVFQDSLVAVSETSPDITVAFAAGAPAHEELVIEAEAAVAPVETLESQESVAPIQMAKAVATEEPSPTIEQAETGLELLVVKALKQGQSETYIGALVNDAAGKGKVEIPVSLVTEDGSVDTDALLANLTSAIESPIAEGDSDDGPVVHVVEPGENLASLSYRFFGRADLGGAIYIANQNLMKSPDRIEAGMRLIIPEL